MKKFLAILSVAATAATGAQAVTINLHERFGPSDVIVDPFNSKVVTFNEGGVSGSIEAFSTNTADTPAITTNTYGLGVQNGPNDVAYFTSNGVSNASDDFGRGGEIDGRYQDDWLTFTFTNAVRLISLTLANFNGNAPYGDNAYIEVNGVETQISNYFHSFGDVVANSFTVRARDDDDEFLAYSFTVAPIPLPASSLLLLGGLAGFAAIRRRQRKA